jgi:uncharacterized membrane protein YkoI
MAVEMSSGPGYARMIVFLKIFFVFFVSLVLAVVPISVFARELDDTSVAGSAQGASQSDNAGTMKGTRAFPDVRVSFRRAIAIAESHTAGAKIVDIDVDEEPDRIAYKVKTYQHNEIWTGTIDASTGDIIGGGVVKPVASLEEREKKELANFKVAGMDLSEAIAIAEEYGAGSVVSAGLEERNGNPIFVVLVAAEGALKEVSVEMARSCRDNRRTARKGTRRSSIGDDHCKATLPSALD